MAKNKKNHFKLQKSEAVIVRASSEIYAAYISSGRVEEGQESAWMKRSIREAITIARWVDDAVISDEEVDDSDGFSIGRSGGGKSRHS